MALLKKKTIISFIVCFVFTCLLGTAAFAMEPSETPNASSLFEKMANILEQDEKSDSTEQTVTEPIYPQSIDTESILNLIPAKTATYTVIDVETGKSFEAVRYGGNKHLDTEPKTENDAKIIKSFGESWDRRAAIIYYNGSFYAASMNTKPHGNGYIKSNDFNGHFCIHVTGSKTHGGNKICELHQGMVSKSLATDLNSIPAAAALTEKQPVPKTPVADDADEEYSVFVVTNPTD